MVEQIKVTRHLLQFRPGTHRPGSVDIDSFYEDGSDSAAACDLMTKFTSAVRRASNQHSKNSHRPRGRFGRGLAKKNGAGGAYTWGAEFTPDQLENGIDPIMDNSDPLDPNYDSDSEENCKFEAITPPLDDDQVDKYLTPILQEYFEHGVTQEVLTTLDEVNITGNQYRIPIVLITLALDRKSSHRELASVLISDLFGARVLTSEHIQRGLSVLLAQLDDLELDTPDACTCFGNFIARAVADDCIPPKYVTGTKEQLESKLGGGKGMTDAGDSSRLSPAESRALVSLTYANSLISTKSHLTHLDTIWGLTGGARPVKYLIKQMRLLLKEHLSSLDASEAERCLRELEVPHFYHEFVYETILMAVENIKKPDELMALAKLLKSLSDINLVSVDQMKKGFMRLFAEMADIHIDVPHAYQTLERFMQACFSVKLFLPHDVIASVPSRGRKRFISEGDGGRFKD